MFGLDAFDEDGDAGPTAVRGGGNDGYPQPVSAGGMVYLSGVGPVDPESGRIVGETIQAQTRQLMENLKTLLERAGASLGSIVWATWGLRSMSEYDGFLEEWNRWMPEDAPGRHGTLVPVPQRQGEFRISVSVIAQSGVGIHGFPDAERYPSAEAFSPTPARTPGPR
jgi:2-iminobutanoate/2-iminopropanoate deaminase